MEKYHATVHLPMAPLHTVEGAMEITDAIDYGLDHGAGSFVIHPAEVEWGRFWRRSTGFDFAEAKTVGLNQLKGILQYYDKENITIAIENLAGPVPYGKDPNDFDYMFGKHGQLSAGLCLDVCHAVNVGLDPVALLQKYRQKEQLFEVHLADTEIINGPDKHCALGKGKVPLNTILDALRDFNGPVIIEVSDKDFEPSWKELVKILAANIGN